MPPVYASPRQSPDAAQHSVLGGSVLLAAGWRRRTEPIRERRCAAATAAWSRCLPFWPGGAQRGNANASCPGCGGALPVGGGGVATARPCRARARAICCGSVASSYLFRVEPDHMTPVAGTPRTPGRGRDHGADTRDQVERLKDEGMGAVPPRSLHDVPQPAVWQLCEAAARSGVHPDRVQQAPGCCGAAARSSARCRLAPPRGAAWRRLLAVPAPGEALVRSRARASSGAQKARATALREGLAPSLRCG